MMMPANISTTIKYKNQDIVFQKETLNIILEII
jgi:hypothetical protein